MKTISFKTERYDSMRRYIVELTEREADRFLTHQARFAMQNSCTLGQEFDLTPVFDEQDLHKSKSRQLDELMRSITQSKDLVFPETEKKES